MLSGKSLFLNQRVEHVIIIVHVTPLSFKNLVLCLLLLLYCTYYKEYFDIFLIIIMMMMVIE